VSLLQALLDESSESLLALDSEGRIVAANAAAPVLLGVGAEPIESRTLEELVPPAARGPLRELLRNGGQRLELDVATGRAELRVRPLEDGFVLLRLRPQFPEGGWATEDIALIARRGFLLNLPYGVVTVDRDGKVEFANSLAKELFKPASLHVGRTLPEPWPGTSLSALLEGARGKRAAAQARIIEAADRTLRVLTLTLPREESVLLVVEDVTRDHAVNRIYGEFVRNAAHQLRTPAAAIASAVEVLQGGAKEIPAERDRFLAHVERETRRLTRLTQALLVLARADAGVQAPRLAFVPLEPLLREVIAGAEATGGSVELTCDPSVAVFVQRDLAEQAFQALVENAVRHGRDGTLTIAVKDSGASRVCVEIHNAGDPILPEQLERIREPFYRGSPDSDGFGLGLAIAAQAVAAIGGTLAIDSARGTGTKVMVELPSARIAGQER
jgi:two-component system, OmpR family, phosphate regulon sensor histidine kinase PhoR